MALCPLTLPACGGDKATLKGAWLGDLLTEANREMQQVSFLETHLELDLINLKQESWRTKQLACDLSAKSNAGLRQVSFHRIHPFHIAPELPRWDSPCAEAGRAHLTLRELCADIASRLEFASRIRDRAPTEPPGDEETKRAISHLLWAYAWASMQLREIKTAIRSE